MWAISRVVVVYSLLWLAPAAPLPINARPPLPGWDAFLYLDGPFYAAIGARGYDYAPDGGDHSVAFFPLYPLLVAAFMRVTLLPFAIAGTIVSNAAFLGALFAIFHWTRERHGAGPARWAVLTLCALPLSIFGSLTYTEGLFLLLSTLALRAYEREQYGFAGMWGAFASATRASGIALAPAFLLGALLRRSPRAAGAALLATGGVAAFAAFCGLAFGDPLAFVHAQTAWRGDLVGMLWPWQHLAGIFFGTIGPQRWPLQLGVGAACVLWWFLRRRIPAPAAFVLGAALAAAELDVWFESPTTLLLVFGGALSVVGFCRRLGAVPTCYALLGIAMILLAGFPLSADRIAYAIVPIDVALALVWDRVPGAGTVLLAGFATHLPGDAVKIAQRLWWVR